jgi:type 1 glutamine amidotransferase
MIRYVAWIKPHGKGRVFYCSLGHNHHIFWNPKVLRHYLAGIQWALGDYEVEVKP